MTTLLSIAAVCERTGLSRDAVSRAIRAGELRASKRRSRWLISEDDFQAWLDAGVPEPAVQSVPRRRRAPRRTAAVGGFRDFLRAVEGGRG